jgi:hypothetical protein
MMEEGLEFIDWLPWNHTFGGNHNFGLTLYNGGSLYIDDGNPTPQGIAITVANLKERRPTIYFNVPKGFEELILKGNAYHFSRHNFPNKAVEQTIGIITQYQSPNLKPYIPEIDSFPTSSSGWLEQISQQYSGPSSFDVQTSPLAKQQLDWLNENWKIDFFTQAIYCAYHTSPNLQLFWRLLFVSCFGGWSRKRAR